MVSTERTLDVRSFQEIVDEARRLIPIYCPEWTDHNVSDPGITLIELFAWMTEVTLYQLNRVPDRMYERFLDLVGIARQSPHPASVDVTFNLAAPLDRPIDIPAGTELATERTTDHESLVFTTMAPLRIETPVLTDARSWRQGAGFDDYLQHLRSGVTDAPVFNESPQEGDALYVGFGGDLAGVSLEIALDCTEGTATSIDPVLPPLVWEYWSTLEARWKPSLLLRGDGSGTEKREREPDGTRGLTRSGSIFMFVPIDAGPSEIDGTSAHWLRVRYVRLEGQGYERSPAVSALETFARGGTVRARHEQAVRTELLGESSGEPSQEFSVRNAPLTRWDPLQIDEINPDGSSEEWTEVVDFAESTEADRHFTVDYLKGQVLFGPRIWTSGGHSVQHGAVPKAGRRMRLREYRSGGGVSGNIGAGAITHVRSSLPYVASVTNYHTAADGRDAETLDEVRFRAARVLRHTETAVTIGDYERLAEAIPGVLFAHAQAADDGRITLTIVPVVPTGRNDLSADDVQPSPELLRRVSSEIDERKLIGVQVAYQGPAVTMVDFDAHVYARRGADLAATTADAEDVVRTYLHPTAAARSHGAAGLFTESVAAGILQAIENVAFVERVRIQQDDEDTSRAEPQPGGLLVLRRCYILSEVAPE